MGTTALGTLCIFGDFGFGGIAKMREVNWLKLKLRMLAVDTGRLNLFTIT